MKRIVHRPQWKDGRWIWFDRCNGPPGGFSALRFRAGIGEYDAINSDIRKIEYTEKRGA